MRIANADKLKEHFEHVVMVKHFTVPEILTIIDTFSSEVDENDIISRSELMKAIGTMVEAEMPIDEKWALGLKYSFKVIDNAPPARIGGTKP